jgi:hypothetical protein
MIHPEIIREGSDLDMVMGLVLRGCYRSEQRQDSEKI